MNDMNHGSIRRGSDNIFADLGYADADTHLVKAQLANRIGEAMAEGKLTQTAAARIIGMSQPDLSRLLKGQFRDVSIERLMRALTRLGCEVDIVIRQPDHENELAIHFHSAAE
jgi:predicted XRE-type DNA-binding protein